MVQSIHSHFSFPRAAVWALATALFWSGTALAPVWAQSGLFSNYPGQWSGSGKIRVKSSDTTHTERIRCAAGYQLGVSHDIDLRLQCKSDSYDFDLTGHFQADANNRIIGLWTEHSRNVGGTVIGTAQGDRLQIHVKSSALSATLVLITRGRRQLVDLDAHGGGQTVTADITLQRR